MVRHQKTFSKKITDPVAIMQQAITVAKRGAGFVHTNPLVGAVLVLNNVIVAEAYHARYGGPHAERALLQKAQQRFSRAQLRRATLYLTLEPCTHTGKTPPCLPLILASGIKQVVIGTRDPNPQERGRSIRQLRQAGITVTTGVAQADCDYLIRTFRQWITTHRPYVLAKVGMSLDGRISTAGHQQYITNHIALRRVHELRQTFDAIIVGANTVIKDQPRLTTRLAQPKLHHPIKVVLDSYLRTPPHSRTIDERTIMVCREDASTNRKTQFSRRGASIIELPVHSSGHTSLLQGHTDIDRLLYELGQKQISSVIVEGGAGIFTSFINAQAIDEWYCFVAPYIYGALRLPLTYALDRVVALRHIQVEQLADNILIRGYATYQKSF